MIFLPPSALGTVVSLTPCVLLHFVDIVDQQSNIIFLYYKVEEEALSTLSDQMDWESSNSM